MVTAYGIIRTFLAIGTWGSVGLALLTRDGRWFVASGLLGGIWWAADHIREWIIVPVAEFLTSLLRGEVDMPPAKARLTVEDTVRLLEGHIHGDASRSVQIQSAMRLSDLYRVVYKDDLRAQAVLQMVRDRFPDAEELKGTEET